MGLSTSPNALLQIKPNRFFKSRLRNIRWYRGMPTEQVDEVQLQATEENTVSTEYISDPVVAVPSPSNSEINELRNRYN